MERKRRYDYYLGKKTVSDDIGSKGIKKESRNFLPAAGSKVFFVSAVIPSSVRGGQIDPQSIAIVVKILDIRIKKG